MDCGITRNMYLVSVPGSRHRGPKTLVISSVIGLLGISFVLTFGLGLQFLSQSSSLPRNLLGDRSIFCSNKTTLGWLIGLFLLNHNSKLLALIY